jgi:5-methylcytosine-specific restriction endonuclease McrA
VLKQYEVAEQYYELVLEKDPENGPSLNNLSLIFEGRNKLVEALGFAKRAAEAEPKNERYVARYEQLQKNVYHQPKSGKKPISEAKEVKQFIRSVESKEKEITKSLRFEIFKRDKFTCQYCGRQTPTVVLEIDHIIPKVEGGPLADPNNLITACFDCNRGKGKIPLGVQRVKDDRKEAIQQEREKQLQIKEYEEFLKEKQEHDGRTIEELNEHWSNLCENRYDLNLSGIDALKRFLKFLTPAEIKDSMEIAASRIPITQLESRFKYFCGVCYNKKDEKTGDSSRKTFKNVQKYYLSQPRGSGYHKEYLLKKLCGRYTEEVLKEAVDVAFSRGQSNYWEAFCEALADLTGDEIPAR